MKSETRYRWLPDFNSQIIRPSDRPQTVHAEHNHTLNQLQQGSDTDFKLVLARRLTREMVKKGQADFACDYIPLFLFSDSKRTRPAAIALEIYKLEKGSAVPGRVAGDLKGKGLKLIQYPPSALTLFAVLGMDAVPSVPAANPSESLRLALVGRLLLEGNADEALKVAMPPVSPSISSRH